MESEEIEVYLLATAIVEKLNGITVREAFNVLDAARTIIGDFTQCDTASRLPGYQAELEEQRASCAEFHKRLLERNR